MALPEKQRITTTVMTEQVALITGATARPSASKVPGLRMRCASKPMFRRQTARAPQWRNAPRHSACRRHWSTVQAAR